jgi:hypothetical protein
MAGRYLECFKGFEILKDEILEHARLFLEGTKVSKVGRFRLKNKAYKIS